MAKDLRFGASGGGTPGGGGGSLDGIQISDEGTRVGGLIDKLNFIGADVNVTLSNNPGEVNIYIPTFNTSSRFNTNTGTTNATVTPLTTVSRLVAGPTTEGNPFKIGDWVAGTAKNVTRAKSWVYSTVEQFFLTTLLTTFKVSILDANETTVVNTHTFALTANRVMNSTDGKITLTVTNFEADGLGHKCKISVAINIATILPNGGRASVVLDHIDGSETFTFKQDKFFYDNEPSVASLATVTIVPTAGQTVSRSLSGISNYTNGSKFTISLAGLNNLNANTYPTIQVNATAVPFAIAPLNLNGGNLTGWTVKHDVTGVSYVKTDCNVATANVSTSGNALVSGRVIDWTNGPLVNSVNGNYNVDTYVDNATRVYEDFRTETHRLTNSFTAWDSVEDITSYDGGEGLQLEDSRLVYPTKDYTSYLPVGPNYSTVSGVKKYQRRMWHTNVAHSNGIIKLGDTNVVDADITSSVITIEVSLDGLSWFSLNKDYLGGAIADGDGCRINKDTVKNGSIEFTLGTGKFTSASSDWGVIIRITQSNKTKYIGTLEITNWI